MHSDAPSAAATDWRQIVTLYDQLAAVAPGPVVSLNRAVAVAEVDGPAAALDLVDGLDLDGYYLLHAIRADLLRRLGRDSGGGRGLRRGDRPHRERGRARVSAPPPRGPLAAGDAATRISPGIRNAALTAGPLLSSQGLHRELVVLADEAIRAEDQEDAGGPGDLAGPVPAGLASWMVSVTMSSWTVTSPAEVTVYFPLATNAWCASATLASSSSWPRNWTPSTNSIPSGAHSPAMAARRRCGSGSLHTAR